jgi:hypothetical protein
METPHDPKHVETDTLTFQRLEEDVWPCHPTILQLRAAGQYGGTVSVGAGVAMNSA